MRGRIIEARQIFPKVLSAQVPWQVSGARDVAGPASFCPPRAFATVPSGVLERLAAAYAAGRLRFTGACANFRDAAAFAQFLSTMRGREWVVYANCLPSRIMTANPPSVATLGVASQTLSCKPPTLKQGCCGASVRWVLAGSPIALVQRATIDQFRVASAIPMELLLNGVPVGASTSASFIMHRLASGTSDVMTIVPRPDRSTIQSSAASGPLPTTNRSSPAARGTGIGLFGCSQSTRAPNVGGRRRTAPTSATAITDCRASCAPAPQRRIRTRERRACAVASRQTNDHDWTIAAGVQSGWFTRAIHRPSQRINEGQRVQYRTDLQTN
jgi:hypothetical protein